MLLLRLTLLQDVPDLQFVLVGEGAKKAALMDMAGRQGLKSILFLPYQSREDLSDMLAASDLSLVTLNEKSADSSLPSKVFNYMASGRPVLCVAPAKSDLARLVTQGNFGVTVQPDHPAAFAEVIRKLYRQEYYLQQLGQTGRSLLETKYSRKHCVDLYEEMLAEHQRQPQTSKTRGSSILKVLSRSR